MTGCGNTTEARAAVVHGVIGALTIALVALEAVVAAWHLWSVVVHLRRA